jgi:uncharacterized protein (TIGR02391 family)
VWQHRRVVGHEALIPPNEQALELSVERLAMLLLRAVNEHHSICNRHNVTLPDAWREHYAEPRGREFLAAISEAFSWLERQGLVAPGPGQSGEGMIVTRRGKELLADDDALGNLLASSRLALELHDRLGSRVRQLFESGDFEMAVVRAMREVEVRVRELSGLPQSLIGTDLMKQAFRDGGPLTDPAAPTGEQEAAMALYWGAIGLFRNPVSHREVEYEDATIASEVIFLADLLLRVLDRIAVRLGK